MTNAQEVERQGQYRPHGDGKEPELHLPGRNRDEWYLWFEDSRWTSSGYNRAGINDLSSTKLWPQNPA